MVEIRLVCKWSSGDAQYDLFLCIHVTAAFIMTQKTTQDSLISLQFLKFGNLCYKVVVHNTICFQSHMKSNHLDIIIPYILKALVSIFPLPQLLNIYARTQKTLRLNGQRQEIEEKNMFGLSRYWETQRKREREHVYIHMHIYIHVYIFTCMYMCTHIHNMCIYLCMYAYLYRHIHTLIHILRIPRFTEGIDNVSYVSDFSPRTNTQQVDTSENTHQYFPQKVPLEMNRTLIT